MSSPPGRAPLGVRVAILGTILAVVLLMSWGLSAMWRSGGEPQAATPPAAPPTTAAPRPDGVPLHTRRPRLFVPQIDVDALIVPIQLEPDGVLDPPSSVAEVGWWDGSARAGESQGQTVLTGHTVSSGGGVLDDLDGLTEGDLVHLTDRNGRVDYVVTQVAVWSKKKLAQNAVETFGQDRHHGRLVLVTCEDWVEGDYRSNVVVFADPVPDAA